MFLVIDYLRELYIASILPDSLKINKTDVNTYLLLLHNSTLNLLNNEIFQSLRAYGSIADKFMCALQSHTSVL